MLPALALVRTDTVVVMDAGNAQRCQTSGRPGATPGSERCFVDGAEVEIRRSARRRRTVSAYEQQGRLVILVPDTLTPQEETEWVRKMSSRLRTRGRLQVASTDDALASQARELSRRYLGGRAVPNSIRWSNRQHRRWGSCTPSSGAIRISEAVRPMPDWVRDYVLLHELVHLLEPGHGPRFWALLEGYPRLERARGYLEGFAAAEQQGFRAAANAGEAGGFSDNAESGY